MRTMLATNPPALAVALTTAARSRLGQTAVKLDPNILPFFESLHGNDLLVPTPHFSDTIARARSLFGAGMGVTSLGPLTSIVRASVGSRWSTESELADALDLVDADICQALQVSPRFFDRRCDNRLIKPRRARGRN